MADPPENPRAFPSSAIDPRFGGMDLLDHFAGLALTGLIACCVNDGIFPNEPDTAEFAYAFADAMMAERAKRKAAQ